jgi:DNA-binding NarL/FixJ family response regulator
VTIRVVVADDAPFVRMAIRAALMRQGMSVVAEVADAVAAVAAVVERRPDVLLIDSELDPSRCAIAAVSRDVPGTATIVLAAAETASAALSAVRAGAVGFLPKDTSPDRLPAVVAGAVAGEAVMPRRVMRSLLDELREPALRRVMAERCPTDHELTPREWEALRLISEGLSDREVAMRLGVADVTVRRHTSMAMKKLRVNRRAEAVVMVRSVGV